MLTTNVLATVGGPHFPPPSEPMDPLVILPGTPIDELITVLVDHIKHPRSGAHGTT